MRAARIGSAAALVVVCVGLPVTDAGADPTNWPSMLAPPATNTSGNLDLDSAWFYRNT